MFRTRALFLCIAAVVLTPPGAASAQDKLPNMRAFPAFDIQLSADGNTLYFSTLSGNLGEGALEVAGGDANPGTGVQDVIQHIYQSGGGFREESIGTFVFHPTHNHIHLEDYVKQEMWPLTAPGGSRREGTKTSFCLIDNTRINRKLPGAPKKPVYTFCNRDLQGISIGYGDTYGYYLDGQSLNFAGNPTGTYVLALTVNPNGNIWESDYTDNTACVVIHIDREERVVETLDTTCNPSNPSVTIDEVTPNSVVAGTSLQVTITGSGFDGISIGDVSFLNGSGKAPQVADLAVVNDGTMVATVSVAKGGSPSDPVWDLKVGSTMKIDALTVLR